jgi:hypothetical protein
MEYFTCFSSEEIVSKFVDGEEAIETFLEFFRIVRKFFPPFLKELSA